MKRCVVVIPAISAIALSACATGPPSAASHLTPSPSSVAASVAPAASRQGPCIAGDLNAVIGSGGMAAGGQTGAYLYFGNHSGMACTLAGVPGIHLIDAQAQTIPSTVSPLVDKASRVVLVPGHVALDPTSPQPGEAQLTISWRTGDVQPGVCSRESASASAVQVVLPGAAGTVTATVPAGQWQMAPCAGKLEAFSFAAIQGEKPFGSASDATISAAQRAAGVPYSAGSCEATQSQMCVTGGALTAGDHAAYAKFDEGGTGSGALCFVYVFQDAGGWHPRNTVCTQNSGYAPVLGEAASIRIPGGGCANVRSAPGRGSRLLACITDQTAVKLDGGPAYVAEATQPDQVPDGTIWWHIAGKGWMAHDFLAAPAGS